MSKAKLPTNFNPGKPATSCYGYAVDPANPARGMGRNAHFVYPNVFSDAAANGLVRGAGQSLATLTEVYSDFLDLSGWARWQLIFSFAALGVGGASAAVQNYADPAFSNLIIEGVQSPGAIFAAGATYGLLDSTVNAGGIPSVLLTPYIRFGFYNATAAPLVFTAVLFCYDTLAR